MLLKAVAALCTVCLYIVSVFVPAAELPEKSKVLTENEPQASAYRTADRIDGASGTVFYIERPKAESLSEVNASQFGLSEENEDNFSAFSAAIAYCAKNPNTKLVIDKGTYYFRNPASLVMHGLKNILVEGNGATFVFSDTGYRFMLAECDGVEFCNISFDWNWAENPLASVAEVISSQENSVDLCFFEERSVNENMDIQAVTQCDPEALTFGAKGSCKEWYVYQAPESITGVEKVNQNTLRVYHNGLLSSMESGEKYIVRHFVYGGTVFDLRMNSRNITFDGVNIYGSPGMAFICEDNCSHFQIINSTVGVNPEYEDSRHVSITADAVHIVNTNGCFNISGCDFSGMGDDAVNVHDGLGYISAASGRKLTVIASAMRLQEGDTLGFRDGGFNSLEFIAKIKSVKNLEGITKEIELDRDIPQEIAQGCIVYSKECDSSNYVIINNYFHEHRARGLLLQSANGLCENNRFYKIMGQAVKVIMDIQPALWQEGTGVDNLVIRNNSFEKCSYSNWGSIIEIGSNIAGKKATAMPFTNIEITSNSFIGCSSRVMLVNNVNGLKIENNTIEIGTEFEKAKNQGKIYFDKSCANIYYKNNTWLNDALGIKSIAQSEKIRLWFEINSQLV